jgi:hypothetical protein
VLLLYINPKLNIETQRGEVFGQLMIDSLRLFLFQKLIERTEKNVKIFYVWYITGRDRAANDAGAKFPSKKKWNSH